MFDSRKSDVIWERRNLINESSKFNDERQRQKVRTCRHGLADLDKRRPELNEFVLEPDGLFLLIFFSILLGTDEESPEQIIRNMHSIGMNLEKHIAKGLLKFHASRPTLYGLEMHLVMIYKLIKQFKPAAIVLDPISNLITVGSVGEVKSILTRLIDFLQSEQVTVMFTALTMNTIVNDQTDEGVSSLVDSWILLRDIELNGERNRGLYIIKSRGIKHSNQVREFVISNEGLRLEDVYLGPEGILTGSAREAHKLQKQMENILSKHALGRKDKEIERKAKELQARIATLNFEFESIKEALKNDSIEEELRQEVLQQTVDKETLFRDNKSGGGRENGRSINAGKNKRK